MAVVASSVTVATTATLVSGAESDDRAGQSLQFTTPASPVLYAGGSGVTSSNGYPLLASTEYMYDLGPGEGYYLAVASGTVALTVLRTGA